MKYVFKTKNKAEAKRMLKADDMYAALFTISNNAWRTLPEEQQQGFLDKVHEALDYYEINLDEMCLD